MMEIQSKMIPVMWRRSGELLVMLVALAVPSQARMQLHGEGLYSGKREMHMECPLWAMAVPCWGAEHPPTAWAVPACLPGAANPARGARIGILSEIPSEMISSPSLPEGRPT